MKNIYTTVLMGSALLLASAAMAQSERSATAATPVVHAVKLVDPNTVHPSTTSNAQRGGGVPVNDACGSTTAVPLPIGGSITLTGDNTNATIAGDYEAGSDLETELGPTVWHQFTISSCANVTAAYCGTSPVFGNLAASLITSCPGTDAGSIGYSAGDFSSCPDGNATISWLAVPAGTYYFPVLMSPDTSEGAYTINLSATACAAIPANDACGATPASLAVGGSVNFTGTTAGATIAGDFVAGSALEGIGATVWHAITTTECATVTVSYCGTSPSFETVLAVLLPTCPGGDDYILRTTNDFTTCVDGNATSVFVDLPAGTYQVPVMFEPALANGPYTINVSAAQCGSGVHELNSPNVTVFPNPSQGNITISGVGLSGKVDFELTDMTGRVVYKDQKTMVVGQPVTLGLNGKLAKGTYSLRMITTNGISSRPVMIK